MKNVQQAWKQAMALKDLHAGNIENRRLIRDICNGGPEGIAALMGQGTYTTADRLPSGNAILSGLNRLGQKLGRRPSLKVPRQGDSQRQASKAEKLERIVHGYDHLNRLHMGLPQRGRWLPGYGFDATVGRPITYRHPDGTTATYPGSDLRDPYNTFPGRSGPATEPDDICFTWLASTETLKAMYPEAQRLPDDGYAPGVIQAGWRTSSGTEVVEYIDIDGTWVMCQKLLLDFIPNPITSRPSFVVCRRPSFDKTVGQYDQGIGPQAAIAEMKSLLKIALKDAVNSETNIFGQPPDSGEYRRGRGAVNTFREGTQVQVPQRGVPFQAFQITNVLEKDLRDTVGYSPVDDGRPVQSYTTGEGTDRLMAGNNNEITEYLTVIGDSIERADALSLEWDRTVDGDISKPICGTDENYRPSRDITSYRTQRVYGVMAGLDNPVEIVGFLQTLGADVISADTVRENLDGIDDPTREKNRVTQNKAEQALMSALAQAAQAGDPKATMALIDIYRKPDQLETALVTYYTPESPSPTPEQNAMMGPPPGPAPDVATLMGMLGGAGGGAPPGPPQGAPAQAVA